MDYLWHIGVLVGLYWFLAWSLNLVAGQCGLVSLAHAAFFGTGAYVCALLTFHNVPWGVAFILAGLLAVSLAAFLSLFLFRSNDEGFIVLTFALQVIATTLMMNWHGVTRGPLGLPGIQSPSLFGWSPSNEFDYFLLLLALAPILALPTLLIARSPFGRVLIALREDKTWTLATGRRLEMHQRKAFAFTAGIAGCCGAFYASYQSYIAPLSFDIHESIFIVAIVIIGGRGNYLGAFLASLFLVSIPELLRFVGGESLHSAELRQLIYGAILTAVMVLRPQGMLREPRFKMLR